LIVTDYTGKQAEPRYDIAASLTPDYMNVDKARAHQLLHPDLSHPFELSDSASYTPEMRGKIAEIPFNIKYLTEYPFLEYSKTANSVFCRYCALGFACKAAKRPQGQLITEPLRDFKNAGKVFRTHSDAKYHKNAVEEAKKFLRNEACLPLNEEEIEPVPAEERRMFDPQLVSSVTSIVKSELFLYRQGLATRGSEVVLRVQPLVDEAYVLYEHLPWSYDNFEALLLFRVDSGDDVLLRHLISTASKTKFLSVGTRNKILSYAKDMIQSQIIMDVKQSKFFAIILDGSVDSAGMDQLTFVVRYVWKKQIREEFVEFHDISAGTTGNMNF
jgi:Domain of unknown function (DUF4371)